MIQADGIRIECVGKTDNTMEFASNIRLLGNSMPFLTCNNDHPPKRPEEVGMSEAAKYLAYKLFKNDWVLDIETVHFTRYTIKITVGNPECTHGLQDVLEYTIKNMLLSLVKTYYVEDKILESGRTEIGFRLLPRKEIYSSFLPFRCISMNRFQETEIQKKISSLEGVEEVTFIETNLIDFTVGNIFAKPEHLTKLKNSVINILQGWDPNILFVYTKDKPFDPAARIVS